MTTSTIGTAVTAEHRPLSHAEYHSELEHDSNTSLRLFEESPARYYHTRITKRIPPKVETDAMRLGTATHIAILEPERIHELLEIIPREVLSSSGAKSGKKWDEYKAEFADKVLVKQEEFDDTRWQVESVWSNKQCRMLLERSTVKEHSIFWTDKHGRKLKCRMDAAGELDGLLVDVKRTGRTERDFWRCVQGFKYHCQAALYCQGFKAYYGIRPLFHFLIVQDEPPYEARVRTLPLDALKLGWRENKETLDRLYRCKVEGSPWESEGYAEIREVELPPFFYGDD